MNACASCGTPNEADARFCESCGSPLQRPCDVCGVVASATARFCRACGASLDEHLPQAVPGPTRKTVTVLFADLAGSTAFEELVDPETAREVIGQYHELLRSTAQRHRAGVTKYIGDGFMAVWGVPETGAGDAGQAVDAAVDLQERFVGLAARLTQTHGIDLALRVAVNTGEVVVGTEDADLVGDALNVGARLESECPHGHVVVGEETWRSTRGQHRYDPRGSVHVKGRTAAVPVYQWIGRADPAELVPFVGRSTELRRLHAVFEDAVATRTARLVTIVGDPGVGKTRLATESIAALGDRARVIWARCAVEGSPAMAPLVDVLRTRDLDADLPAGVAERGRILRDLTGMTAGVAGSVEEAFWALRRYIEVSAADGPVVIVVDDIHWADTLLLDFIEHLVEWVRTAPVLLVALARPELRESRPDLVTVGGSVTEALRLHGLEADATAELAAGVLGSDRLPEELLGRLPSSTGGNPLFVRELVGMLVHDGVLVAKPEGWSLTVDVDAISVPPTIQALLASRLERLNAANRRVLEVASVIGTDFLPSAVAALAGVGEAEVTSALNRLRRLDLAQPSGMYAGDDPVWRFHHVLIRDVSYRRLLKSERAELHERLANWVHAGGASVAFESEEVIARNLEAAHGYRCDLVLRDGHTDELALRSARNYLASAKRALDRDELGSAGGQAARGAALAITDSALQAELLLIGCEAFLSAGDVAAGAPLVDDLESIAGQELSAWAVCYRCQLVVYTDPTSLLDVDARLSEAIDEFGQRKDAAGLAKAHRVRANARARLGRVGDCEVDLFEALIAARQGGDHRQITAALSAAPNAALWGPSPAPKAGGRCLDVVRMQRMTTAAPSLEATSLRCLAVLELLRGRPDKARTMLAEARQVVADLGLRHGLMETELFAGIIELMVGDPVAAEPHFRTALEGLDALGVGSDAGQAAALLARSVLAQGRIDEADRYAAQSERIAGHNLKTAIAWRAVRAEILAAQDRHEAAVTLAREAVAVAADTDLVLDHAEACLALSRVLAAAGDQRAAAEARRDGESLYAAKDASFMVGRAAQSVTPAAVTSFVPVGDVSRLAVRNRASDSVEAGLRAMQLSYADDFSYDDRRKLKGDPIVGSAEFRTAAQRKLEQYPHVDVHPLAVRGETLVLISLHWSDDAGNRTGSLDVFEVGDGPLLTYHGRFDDDDFDGAYRELEKRYYAREGSEFAPNGHGIASFLEAMDRLDLEAARNLTVGDFRWIAPPSALTSSERTLDDLFRWLQERAGQVATSRNWAAAIHWLSPNCYVALGNTRSAGLDGEDYQWSRLYVGWFRDALLVSVHQFELDDEAAAFAYAELLVAQRPSRLVVANAASRVADRIFGAVWADDAKALSEYCSTAMIYDDRRRLAGALIAGTDFFSESVAILVRQYDHVESRTLAVRDERLCLTWSSWWDDTGNEATHLHVVELGDDALIVYLGHFDENDFWGAYRELESRYYAGEGARFATNGHALTDWLTAVCSGDLEAARCVSHPDFRWIATPKALKPMERSVDDMFEWMHERGRQVESLRHWVPVLHWVSPNYAVGRGEISAVGADGEKYTWNFASVAECRDGLLVSVREFDVDDEEAAFAYADSLGTSRNRLSVANRASAVADGLMRAMQAHDIDSSAAYASDDFVLDDRRQITWHRGDIRRALELVFQQYNHFETATLAVRGERLCFGGTRWCDDAGNTATFLSVFELSDDERLGRWCCFDEDDFEAAYGELDSLYYAGEGAPHAEAGAALTQLVLAESRGDLDGAFSMLLAPGLRIESRSRSLFPSRSAEELRRSVEELGAMVESYRIWSPAVVWLSDEWMVGSHEREAVGHDGERYSWARIYAGRIQDGLFTALCEFDVDDEDAAFAYAEQRMRATLSRLRVANLASEVSDRILAGMRAGDLDGTVAHWADQFVYDDRRRLSGDPIGNRTEMREAVSRIIQQYSVFQSHTLAVRGTRMNLSWHTRSDHDGNNSSSFVVAELGDDGRIVYQGRFDEDDFDSAYRELERRYYASEGAEFAASGHTFSVFQQAMDSLDVEAARRACLPEFRWFTTASALAAQERSLDEFFHWLRQRAGQVSSVRNFGSVVRWFSPNCFVALGDARATGADGEQYAWARPYVGEFRDGLLVSMRQFEDEESAFSYAEGSTRNTESRLALHNHATATFTRFVGAMEADDLAMAIAQLAENCYLADHRRLSRDPVSGITSAKPALERILRQFNHFEHRTVAVRGRHLALSESRWSDDAGNMSAYLHVLQVGSDGHIAFESRFDEDDFDSAYRELEERYYAGEGAEFAQHGTTAMEVVLGSNAGALDTVFGQLMAPDLEVGSRSGTIIPDRTARQFRDRVEELAAMVSSTRIWFSAVEWLAPTCAVARQEREAVGEDGEKYVWTRIYVTQFKDGVVTALCYFDVDAEDAAFSYAEELARTASRLTLTNQASEVATRVVQAMQDRDAATAVDFYSDRYVFDDRRRWSGDLLTGKTALRGVIERMLQQFSSFEHRILAVRGERFALTWSRWSDDSGNQTAFYHIYELDDDGSVARDICFDDGEFDSAYRVLEADYHAGEGAAFAEYAQLNAEYVLAMNRGDFDTMFNDLTLPDLRVENRSRSGFPDRSAGDLRASLEELYGMVASVRSWFSTLRWLSPALVIARLEREGSGHDEERYDWSRILVVHYRDERVASIGEFDAEDDAAAFAYAEDLASQT